MSRQFLIVILGVIALVAVVSAYGSGGLTLASLSALAPYGLLLLCPLMMLFMMRGHDHGAAHEQHIQSTPQPVAPELKPGEPAPERASTQAGCH